MSFRQLQYSRHFWCGEPVVLQVEMTALVSLASDPVLAGQDEQLGRWPRARRSSLGRENEKGSNGRLPRSMPTFRPTQKPNHTTCSASTGPRPAVYAISR